MDLVGGGVDSRGSYISKILYVKTKELGPLGGAARAGRAPLDPPMARDSILAYLGCLELQSLVMFLIFRCL